MKKESEEKEHRWRIEYFFAKKGYHVKNALCKRSKTSLIRTSHNEKWVYGPSARSIKKVWGQKIWKFTLNRFLDNGWIIVFRKLKIKCKKTPNLFSNIGTNNKEIKERGEASHFWPFLKQNHFEAVSKIVLTLKPNHPNQVQLVQFC